MLVVLIGQCIAVMHVRARCLRQRGPVGRTRWRACKVDSSVVLCRVALPNMLRVVGGTNSARPGALLRQLEGSRGGLGCRRPRAGRGDVECAVDIGVRCKW
jgi:hypothetical protein